MTLINSYHQLPHALTENPANLFVYGIDFETMTSRPFQVLAVRKVINTRALRLTTMCYRCTIGPDAAFVTGKVGPAFSTPLKEALSFVRVPNIKPGLRIAVANLSLLTNTPHQSATTQQGYFATWDAVRSVQTDSALEYYKIALKDGDNYILNNIVHLCM